MANGVITKAELRDQYGFSESTFQRLFNKKYYAILQELGYDKNCSKIPPIVLNKFKEIYGEPD